MLKDKLYSVISIINLEGNITAEIQLNKDNEIFKGHFPTQPVLPGACELQILKEILASILNKKIRLKKADQMKFLAVVDPVADANLQLKITYSITENDVPVTALMSNSNRACFKFKGSFI